MRGPVKPLFLRLVLGLWLLGPAQGGKVLALPGEYSHWRNMRVILGELLERNHSVSVLVLSETPSIKHDSRFDFITIDVPMNSQEIHALSEEMIHLWMHEAHKSSRLQMILKTTDLALRLQAFQRVSCGAMLRNQQLMTTLKATKFDTLLIDPMLPCGDLLADMLQVPFVISLRLALGYTMERMCGQMPTPPSYVPISPVQLTDHMNFAERTYNVLLYGFYTVVFQMLSIGSLNGFYSELLEKPSLFSRKAILKDITPPDTQVILHCKEQYEQRKYGRCCSGAPEKLKLFQNVSLSRRTVSDRIGDMAQDIEKSLKDSVKDFEFCSLALDETTDITNTSQLAIFVRGIMADFNTREDLLSLVGMHDTTKGEDIFEKLIIAMQSYGLSLNKLSGLTTDGAPAMVGTHKGLVALIKKEMARVGVDPSSLFTCHCIIHQEKLCSQSLCMKDVMATVVSCVNFIKSRGLNNRQFKEFLKSLETDYGDLVYYCEVRWLSRANMLKRFYELRDAVKSFMETKGKCNEKLNDVKWICDLAFMVDITSYLSELNVKLQGPNQLLVSLLSHVKSFEAKLKLWQVQLARGNVGHFPTLQNHNPVPERTKEYANECTYLLEAFAQRFQDVKAKEQDLNIFATPFNVNVADVPECMQLEIIELQNNCQLKPRHSNMDLLEFYKQNTSACEFPNLRKHALKMASLFETTYCCEQFFSKLSHAKNQLRSRLTDTHLENQLRVATASLPPDIPQLVKTKHSQPSH
ncbi:hypothetical protein MHYP_G00283000 [Metynnis hypsauchen]